MKYTYIIFLSIILISKIYSQDANNTLNFTKPLFDTTKQLDPRINNFPYFIFLTEYQGCAACNYTQLNNCILNLTKFVPSSNIYFYIKIPDSTLIDNSIKSKINTDNVIFLTEDSVFDNLKISSYPTLLVTNFNGDELFRFEGNQLDKLPYTKFKLFCKKNNFNDLTTIKYPIVIPKSLVIKNNLLFFVDYSKNEIGTVNIFTGDSINTITPDDTLRKFFLQNCSASEIMNLKELKYPLSQFKSMLPLSNDSLLCVSTNVAYIHHDTIKSEDENSTNEYKARKFTKIKNVIARIIDGRTTKIDTLSNDNYSISNIFEIDSNTYMSSVLSQYVNVNQTKEFLDTNYAYIRTSTINFNDFKFFLPYGIIKKYYNYENLNLMSMGILRFSKQFNKYYYLNPWMGVFFEYYPELDSIRKIVDKGFLKTTFYHYTCIIHKQGEPRQNWINTQGFQSICK